MLQAVLVLQGLYCAGTCSAAGALDTGMERHVLQGRGRHASCCGEFLRVQQQEKEVAVTDEGEGIDAQLSALNKQWQWKDTCFLSNNLDDEACRQGADPSGVNGTMQCDLVLQCRSFPQDGRNLPDGWDKINWDTMLEDLRFKYFLFLAQDCNFQLINRNVSTTAKNPTIGNRYGYFVNHVKYTELIGAHVMEEEMSSCSGFLAPHQRVAYDRVQGTMQIETLPQTMHLLIEQTHIWFKVPNFHLPPHQPPCHSPFLFHKKIGLGTQHTTLRLQPVPISNSNGSHLMGMGPMGTGWVDLSTGTPVGGVEEKLKKEELLWNGEGWRLSGRVLPALLSPWAWRSRSCKVEADLRGLRMHTRHSTGQQMLTRGQGIPLQINLKIHKAKLHYRYVCNTLKWLKGDGMWEWERELHVLENSDVQALNEWVLIKEEEEKCQAVHNFEDTAEEGAKSKDPTEAELVEALRIEWCKAYVRSKHWHKDIVLVEEEMCCTIKYGYWSAREWLRRVAGRAGVVDTKLLEGLNMYTREQEERKMNTSIELTANGKTE
ncbi:hypothetical protein DFH08DRAFT_802000 [Mycena albidolilacea]|uniref:Uncharacterized protein n=1 Tax=Mycena albidolilacea TaxID=1033008 RepID=A0AAD7AGG1_9AGAR|nr:hypothetical protein DFH08DRAFT_802000 [Mycena albidolilacea]